MTQAEFADPVIVTEPLATMPLAPGAGYNDGTRQMVVTGMRYAADHCIAELRTTQVVLLSHSLTWPELVAHFRLRDGTVLEDPFAPERRIVHGRNLDRFTPLRAFGLQTFDIESREAHLFYPASDQSRPTGPRCEDVTMAIERVTYAGSLTRTLRLSNFRMDDPLSRAGSGGF